MPSSSAFCLPSLLPKSVSLEWSPTNKTPHPIPNDSNKAKAFVFHSCMWGVYIWCLCCTHAVLFSGRVCQADACMYAPKEDKEDVGKDAEECHQDAEY